MTRRFEFQEGTSAKFWEVTVEGTSLTTRYGKLGTAGQSTAKAFPTPEAAQKEAAKLIREKTGKGYVEAGSSPSPQPAAPEATPAFRLVPAAEAFENETWCGWTAIEDTGDFVTSEAEGLVLLVEGDWSTDLKGERTAAQLFPGLKIPKRKSLVAVLVRGTLSMPETVLVSEDMESSTALAVGGDLQARALVLEGGRVLVKGALKASELVYGFYNHGDLRVEGRASAPLVLAQDYTMAFEGGLDCPCVMSAHGGRLDVPVHHRDGDLAKLLHPDLFDGHGHPDIDTLRAFLQAGRSLRMTAQEKAKPPRRTLKKAAQACLDKVLAQESPLRVADLSSSEFTFLPEALRAHAGTLTHLDLSFNPVTLPDWIEDIQALEWLRMDACPQEALPGGLGKLPRLRHLSLARNPLLRFPEGFSSLESLVVGDPHCDDPGHQEVLYGTALKAFPRLRHLVLNLSTTSRSVAFTGPFAPWASDSLEHLVLHVRIEQGFPSSLLDCPRLKTLQVALGPEARPAFLEALPSLRTLQYLQFEGLAPTPEQQEALAHALPATRIHLSAGNGQEEEPRKRLEALCERAYAETDRDRKRPLIAAAAAYATEVLAGLPGGEAAWVSPFQKVWAECQITAAWDELRRESPDPQAAQARLETLEACLDRLPLAGFPRTHRDWKAQIQSLRGLLPR